MNYTKENTEYIIAEYQSNPTRETVEKLSQELGKSVKSIIGKLSREGVYQRLEYTTKTGEKPQTKIEIVEELAELMGISTTALAGLEKAPKSALKILKENV